MNNQEEKKVEVITKTSIATQIATGIGLLAIITAGSGLIAHLALLPMGSTSSGGFVIRECARPSSFNLVSPANGVIDQDDDVTLTWEASTLTTSQERITYSGEIIKLASLGSTIYKLAGTTIQYKVYLGTSATNMAHQTTVYGTSYTAANLSVNTTYYWKIQAYNSCGSKNSSTLSFSTAGVDWFQNLEVLCPTSRDCIPPLSLSACGGNRECDSDGILSCAEWNDVWLTCSGTTNKCPDSLSDKCLQMSICQCNGESPGGTSCDDFIATFTDPCI